MRPEPYQIDAMFSRLDSFGADVITLRDWLREISDRLVAVETQLGMRHGFPTEQIDHRLNRMQSEIEQTHHQLRSFRDRVYPSALLPGGPWECNICFRRADNDINRCPQCFNGSWTRVEQAEAAVPGDDKPTPEAPRGPHEET